MKLTAMGLDDRSAQRQPDTETIAFLGSQRKILDVLG
jgi:hypothetical protein